MRRRSERVRYPLVLALCLALAGCYAYAVQERGPGPAHSTLAIDGQGRSAVRWSYLWGLMSGHWTPVGMCDHGIGRVETRLVWYSVPLMLVTLGTVVPARVTAYCFTGTGPDAGP